MTQDTPPVTLIDPSSEPLSPDEFDAIDTILDDLRSRYDETPQWEFCEGFMAAVICCRRVIPQSEYLPVLLAIGEEGGEDEGSFASPEQQVEFFSSLDAPLERSRPTRSTKRSRRWTTTRLTTPK